ncbi:hypothetical protein QNI16_37810 [Cytophagaceae bacterium YF14B1]|uniref:Uncharacterized protein n=1 Tax=Xanthocytophaga flava TaxID=3048013 RepID=A0AAE3QZI3_9BACT|nr:hypothetical protein [Xanthocytophaga flavus]MDJ1486298.1 hypothetical protein [Xanthocytophaga flavus]
MDERKQGRNPGDLGEDIRKMTLPAGVTRNTVPSYKKAPARKVGC